MQFFRRSMLQVMVSGALCSALPSIAFAQTQKLAPEYDVIVIGSGFAGLAAAISAAENGAKVAVLEKMQVAGGNSSRSGGMMAIPGSSVQKEQGIEDSPAKLAADMKRIGLGLGDPEHIKVVTEHAAPTFEWTKKQGVVWRTDLTGKGGHSARRCLITEEGTGQGILIPFMKASIMTSSDSAKAFSKAGCICSAVFTLVTPKLEPLALGLMKQGKPIFSITSSLLIP